MRWWHMLARAWDRPKLGERHKNLTVPNAISLQGNCPQAVPHEVAAARKNAPRRLLWPFEPSPHEAKGSPELLPARASVRLAGWEPRCSRTGR
jgi:hypothetical protein